ncbi:MAG: hypothetical protein AB7E24_15855 [Novosphingobium sp.]
MRAGQGFDHGFIFGGGVCGGIEHGLPMQCLLVCDPATLGLFGRAIHRTH